MNIGEQIEAILRKQGKSAAWLATQIPCERTNVYNIFRRKSVDARLLMKISQILEHDFFKQGKIPEYLPTYTNYNPPTLDYIKKYIPNIGDEYSYLFK